MIFKEYVQSNMEDLPPASQSQAEAQMQNLQEEMKKVNGQTKIKAHQSGHNTLNRESAKCLLVAHHQQLAHLNSSLELLRFVACGLQALQKLLSLGAWRQGAEFYYLELSKHEEH